MTLTVVKKRKNVKEPKAVVWERSEATEIRGVMVEVVKRAKLLVYFLEQKKINLWIDYMWHWKGKKEGIGNNSIKVFGMNNCMDVAPLYSNKVRSKAGSGGRETIDSSETFKVEILIRH